MVKLQYCSQDSADDLSSIPIDFGSQLKVDSAFYPSKDGKSSTQLGGGGQSVASIMKL